MAGNDVLKAASISPKVIVSQQLGTTEAAVYTVPAATSVKVAQATICNVTANMVPALTLGATAGSGGTFAAGTYYWKVTAKNASGESLASNGVSAVLVLNGTQVLNWAAVPTATSYDTYRGTVAGAQNSRVTTVTTLTCTDTGTSTAGPTPPSVSSFGIAAPVNIAIIQSGGTLGDGTHRVMNAYQLAANDTFSLDMVRGAMLGPGDSIAAFSATTTAVDLVITGTVHA